jgi:AcrR family transcriptional regulator
LSFLGDKPRDRLLAAAAALCAERGYQEIDEATIADRAEVSIETFGELFPEGKEECLAAAENAILLEVVSAVSRTYSPDRSEWENVIFGVREILGLMAANPDFAYLGYVFSRQMAPGKVREINETGHRMLEAMLQRGWDYSQSRDQPSCAALGVLGGAQAIVRRELAAERAQRLPLLLPDCVYIATVPFLGQKEALRLAREAAESPRSGEER